MKILFLCGCLEAGRDGVGDYTTRLSNELRRLGHRTAIIALHDRYASHTRESFDPEDDDGLRQIRLPADCSWDARVKAVQRFVDQFQPDWISLQFVPYSFNDRGMDWKLGPRLTQIIGSRRVHVMFHELWIGAKRGAPLKERLIGLGQRHCLVSLIHQIKPSAVTTSNAVYASLLQQVGISSSLLPLFGNVPIVSNHRSPWLSETLRTAGLESEREKHWLFVFFGTLHPAWSPEPLFRYLAEAAQRAGKKVVIVSIGRLGPGEALWARLCAEFGPTFQFHRLGEQPAGHISALLHETDFGIAASPWQLIGKSGTVASMLEHGVPVIVNRDDVQFRGIAKTAAFSNLLIKMDADFAARLSSAQRQPPRPLLPGIAETLINHLGPVSHGHSTTPDRRGEGCTPFKAPRALHENPAVRRTQTRLP